jgi:magnesium and cobalt transporter
MSDNDNGEGAFSRQEGRSWLERVADLFSSGPTSRGDLVEMLRAAAQRGIIDADALNITMGALSVSELKARDIMVPRNQLVTVRVDARPDEFLPLIIESKHSRFPVVGDDIDDVKGILHAKDVLPMLIERNWHDFDIKDCMRRAPLIPESKRVNVLLKEFRTTRNHMAVVIDEYGHVCGVVTIEDVLEQIVGEIEDEYDVEEEGNIKEIEPGLWTVKAMTSIDNFNEVLGSALPADGFDTVGGYLLKQFGHLPKRGESVEADGFKFRVLHADGRRIRLVQVTRSPVLPDESD